MKRSKRSPGRDPTFEDFPQICREADNLLAQIRKNPKAQSKKLINLKAALIHHLAKKKGINITLNHIPNLRKTKLHDNREHFQR
jgi:hypothetical protein